MKLVTILGSTGSIGQNTLNLLVDHPDKFKVVALTAQKDVETLFKQCQQFEPTYAVLENETAAKQLRKKLQTTSLGTEVLSGSLALQDVAALPEVDYVMAAIVGGAGLLPTLAAAKAGKRILLANKEALVMSGGLFMETIQQSKAVLLPVDSEHNALFQCMPSGYRTGNTPDAVEKIILTASGGPFRQTPLAQFSDISPSQAIQHPTWKMGAKISIDSATMMNKGLEVIEAYWLFNLKLDQIEVVIHPQSIIHSMVCYQDGSMLAQLGSPDMRTPIAYTLSWPERLTTGVKRLNLVDVGQLTFEQVQETRYPCMSLAYSALRIGGTASTILNAANEVAVSAFLQCKIAFNHIAHVVNEVLERAVINKADSLEAILEADFLARREANVIIEATV